MTKNFSIIKRQMPSSTDKDCNLSFTYKRAQLVHGMSTRIVGTRVSLDYPLYTCWVLFNRLLFSMLNNWYGTLVFATVGNFKIVFVYLLWANINVYCSEILKQFVTIHSNNFKYAAASLSEVNVMPYVQPDSVTSELLTGVFVDLNKEYIVCKYHRIWKTLKMFNEKENIV